MSNSVSEDKTSTTTTETAINQEQAIQGSGNLALGAGATGNTVNVTTDDLQALHESLGAATTITGQAASNVNAALAVVNNTTGEALDSNTTIGLAAQQTAIDSEHITAATVGQALTTVGTMANSALGTVTKVNTDSLNFGEQAINAVTAADAQNATNTAMFTSALSSLTGSALQLASNSQTDAFQIAANAAPQTDAAYNEIQSGNTPITPANPNLSAGKNTEVLIVFAALAAVVIFTFRK